MEDNDPILSRKRKVHNDTGSPSLGGAGIIISFLSRSVSYPLRERERERQNSPPFVLFAAHKRIKKGFPIFSPSLRRREGEDD